jgi:alkaline phosphatase D
MNCRSKAIAIASPTLCLTLLAAVIGPIASPAADEAAAPKKTSGAKAADKEKEDDGEIKKGDLGKYKRRHTRVMEFLMAGEFEKARSRLDKWFGVDPKDPENYYMLAVIECQAGQVPQAVAAMQRSLELGLAPERIVGGTHTLLDPVKNTLEFKQIAAKLAGRIVSGPMLGVVTESSSKIWVRTVQPADVQAIIVDRQNPQRKHSSRTIRSTADADLTAVLTVEGLQPSTKYHYSVLVNGVEDRDRQGFQTFTTAPPANSPAKFAVAFGGCAGYTPSNERMWDNILSFHPQALWLLGDNVYSDAPQWPALQYFCFYCRQARPEFRRLTAGTPVYAIYDDHDFGANDCSGGPEIEKPTWKRAVWNVFQEMWLNPAYGGGEKQPGCWFDYHYGDVHFIFLDGRYYRSTGEHGVNPPTMLGPVQKQWLLRTLSESRAKIKVLISPVTWAINTKGTVPDTWFGFQEERKEIFDFLAERKIGGVVLVSSDRHRSDLLKNERPGSYPLHEFNSGLLTNDSAHPTLPTAEFSYNELPTFGLIEFNTTIADPSVSYRIIDVDGREHLKFTTYSSELR